MMIKVNDRVRVKPLQDKEFEEEETLLEGNTATVIKVDNWIYPIELKFDDEKAQEIYEWIGIRRFHEIELDLI